MPLTHDAKKEINGYLIRLVGQWGKTIGITSAIGLIPILVTVVLWLGTAIQSAVSSATEKCAIRNQKGSEIIL